MVYLIKTAMPRLSSVNLVYSHKTLLATDEAIWEKLQAHIGLKINRLLMEGLKDLPPSAVIFLDEADYCIFDLAHKFKQSQIVIGLTGTTKKDLGTIEAHYLQLMRFEEHDSLIHGPENSLVVSNTDVTAFFNYERSRLPRLVFINGEEDNFANMKKLVSNMGAKLNLNISMIEEIRNLRDGETYFVTEELLMRGIDYHSASGEGIELLIASPLAN